MFYLLQIKDQNFSFCA